MKFMKLAQIFFDLPKKKPYPKIFGCLEKLQQPSPMTRAVQNTTLRSTTISQGYEHFDRAIG